MVKQQQPKENPLLSKNIPKPPAISADQPISKEEQNTVPSSTVPQSSNTVINSAIPQSVNTTLPQEVVIPQNSNTVIPQNITNQQGSIIPQNGNAVSPQEAVKQQDTVKHQSSNPVVDGEILQSSNAALPQKTVKQQSSKTAQREKITFYLEPEQANKLYDFMEAFRKRTGVKINQQDMLRRIIDVMTIDTVLP